MSCSVHTRPQWFQELGLRRVLTRWHRPTGSIRLKLRKTPTLVGRRVLITGAARGIGAALARRLDSRGARVALSGLEPELLEEVSRSCNGAFWQVCDVGDRDQVEATVEAAVEELGGLDVVVANAGIAAQMPVV